MVATFLSEGGINVRDLAPRTNPPREDDKRRMLEAARSSRYFSPQERSHVMDMSGRRWGDGTERLREYADAKVADASIALREGRLRDIPAIAKKLEFTAPELKVIADRETAKRIEKAAKE